jgi:hypothetical protein
VRCYHPGSGDLRRLGLGCSGAKGSLSQRPNMSEPCFDLRRAFAGDGHETSHGFSPLLRPGLGSYVPARRRFAPARYPLLRVNLVPEVGDSRGVDSLRYLESAGFGVDFSDQAGTTAK